ncbi:MULTISPECIES: hypothetical protein [Lederbergia]|uniref:Uncharacterized protein n=1 Tax=Lederbergia galactosidilytica TaxID=217031 RepID=A0A178A032_9BACI|nr:MULTISPECIES: hypothetical protein [Lederbergia]KRG13138.1 hypothetical protein ACA30_16155 [Virgibacillus soli]MBP1916451.1 hypothetical protein [Lederbergia galactosidilytica]OAK73515.1 hypothetical protein ABB05_06700 [Lederbergia galactosidilytica]
MKNDSKGQATILKLTVLGLATISAGIALGLWFVIRDTLMTYLLYLSFDKWKIPAVDNFSFVLLGIGWLIYVFLIHYKLTKSLESRKLFSTFLIVCGYQILLLFLCNVSRLLFIGHSEWSSVFLRGGELAISLACLLIAYSWRAKKRFRDVKQSK